MTWFSLLNFEGEPTNIEREEFDLGINLNLKLSRAAIMWITFLDLKGRIVATYQASLISECKETTFHTINEKRVDS